MTSDHEPREPKVEPFAPDVEIRSYGDYRRHIRGHSAKSLQALYDDAYYRRHVGSKEHAGVYFSTLGLGSTEFTVVPLELARPGPGDRVLDVGCGRGEMVFQSAARGAEVVGFDFSEAAIAIAEETRSRHDDEIQERTRFVRGNAEQMPFERASFDTAYLLDVVEHLSKDELHAVLTEVRRVLTPLGVLIIHTPNVWANTVGYWLSCADSVVRRRPRPEHPVVAWTRQLEADDAYDKRKVLLHVHELSPLGLRSALVRAGFTARVWVDEVDHRWSHGADSRARLMRRLVGVSHVHYLVGREMYAVASPRRRRSSV